MKRINPLLAEKLGTLIKTMGYVFVGADYFMQGGRQVLRVYIDRSNEESVKGVTSDDCAKVSYQIGAMLDVEEMMPGRYILEVSSPGINRPLYELEDFQRFVGDKINLKLMTSINERRHFKGILLKVENENLYLSIEGQGELIIPFSNIEKANLIGEVRF